MGARMVAMPALEGSPRPPRRLAALARAALYAAVAFGAAAAVQLGFLRGVAHDGDTDFHVAVGRLIAEHGILRSFPWTPFSLLAEHYADKELLFHLLFAPLARLDPGTAANVVGTLAGGLVLAAAAFVLRREHVPYALAWALVPLLASSVFVYRFALVRPHLLSIALALVVAWAASRERLLPLAAASALYPWAYVAWQLPLVLAAAAETARALAGKRPGWRTLAVAAAGIAAGIALHPNARNLVRFSWTVIADVLLRNAWGGRAGVELGDEFRAFSPREWVTLLAVPAAMAVSALVLAWRTRRVTAVPLAFALLALGFGLLTARTARFAEYFVPFSVVAFALGATLTRPRLVLVATLACCAAITSRESRDLLRGMAASPPRLTAEEARVLASRIPRGAQVFTCDWELTGTLMLALPDRKLMVALDPTLFEVHDPRRYALWYRLPREAPPGLATTIREEFGAEFVACSWDERFRRFFDRLVFEPGVNTVLLSDLWNVYDLRPR